MKLTMTDGMVFEGTQEEWENFIGWMQKLEAAQNEAKKVTSAPKGREVPIEDLKVKPCKPASRYTKVDQPEQPKLKVGDIARAVGKSRYGKLGNGELVEIVESKYPNSGTYKIVAQKADGTGLRMLFREQDLVKVDKLPSRGDELDAIAYGTYVTNTPKDMTRKEIIEMAKKDVAKLLGNSGEIKANVPYLSGHGRDSNRTTSIYCKVEFRVDPLRGKVKALLIGSASGKVRKQDLARCAEGDCFNEYIGKAIALRRVLGIPVPKEYTHAPQPTKVETGHVVRWADTNSIYVIDGMNGKFYQFINANGEKLGPYRYDNIEKYATIIDDSKVNR